MKKSRFQQNRRSKINRIPNYNYLEELSSMTEVDNKSQKHKRKNRQRQENSLGELTKNFIKYIKEKKNKEVNINEAVKKLKVKKRRIYDITNVLEGIGFIKKIEKTKIKWLKDELFKEEFEEPTEIEIATKQKTSQLIKEHEKTNKDIVNYRQNIDNLLESEEFSKYGYITFKDLKCLCEDDQVNLLAIHAPVGTTMEIPDPESCVLVYKKTLEEMNKSNQEYDKVLLESLNKKYQIFFDIPEKQGEIEIAMVFNKIENESNITNTVTPINKYTGNYQVESNLNIEHNN